jgi:hypothetical protein
MPQEMTPNYNLKTHNGISIEIFSGDIPNEKFMEQIEVEACNLDKLSKFKILDSGLALIVNSDTNRIQVLGCPCCYNPQIGQDEYGYPTVNDNRLISIYELENNPDMDSNTGANMWLCPNCLSPITKLYPKFLEN